MNRKLHAISSRIAIAILVLIIGTILWNKWLSYYLYTDVLHLYQNNESFRLCDSVDELTPLWTQNEEYNVHFAEAEKAVAEGKAVSIIARGVILDNNSDVYVDKIIEIIVGTNAKCEQLR